MADRSATAIIVAGDEEIRGLLRGLLRLHRFEVLGEASDEDEGLELLRAHTPRVMIVDALLPAGEAPALLSRAREVAPSTRTVLVASDEESPDPESLAEADVVLHRPLRVREFREALGVPGA